MDKQWKNSKPSDLMALSKFVAEQAMKGQTRRNEKIPLRSSLFISSLPGSNKFP
jgi:hypothetical protein